MKHKIDGKTYTLRLTGTIGILYATERLLGYAPDSKKQRDLIAILYTALQKSGNEMPSREEFEDVMTIKLITELSQDFWEQWNDIEGVPTPETKKPDPKGED